MLFFNSFHIFYEVIKPIKQIKVVQFDQKFLAMFQINELILCQNNDNFLEPTLTLRTMFYFIGKFDIIIAFDQFVDGWYDPLITWYTYFQLILQPLAKGREVEWLIGGKLAPFVQLLVVDPFDLDHNVMSKLAIGL